MDVEKIYDQRFSAEERTAMAAVWKVIVKRSLAKWIKPGDDVIDIGAGACHFINQVSAKRRVALDINPGTAGNCGPGVEFLHGEAPGVLGGQSFDVAFMSNFLEHLPSPEAVLSLLAGLKSHLRPGARLIVLQPNFALTGAAYFDFIDHKTILTDRSMTEALDLSGYDLLYVKRRFLPYTSKSKLPKAPWLVGLYLCLPPAQFLLAGQSLFVATPKIGNA